MQPSQLRGLKPVLLGRPRPEATGEYRSETALQPGHYNVKIEKSGFKTITQTGITLDVTRRKSQINASLEVGSSSQTVTVTSEAPLVETTTSSLAGLINDQKMAELPLNGRNFIDLALLQPGVVNYTNLQNTQAQGGNWGEVFSSNGAPIRSNTFTMDGANMMNMCTQDGRQRRRLNPGRGWHQGIQGDHERIPRGVRAADGQPGGDGEQGRQQSVPWGCV